MRFQIVTGAVFSVTCQGCGEHRLAGSEPYVSASTGQPSGRPDTVYEDLDAPQGSYYCEPCARKHAEGVDPTKAVTQFFADTHGETIA